MSYGDAYDCIYLLIKMIMRNVRVSITQPFIEGSSGIDAAFKDVLRLRRIHFASDLKEFEAGKARILGIKHVFGVADGTNAMVIGFRAVRLARTDEVIVSSCMSLQPLQLIWSERLRFLLILMKIICFVLTL